MGRRLDMDFSEDDLGHATRNELYELAREHDVDGRSSMTKGELVDALGEELGPQRRLASRTDDFRKFAERRAGGDVMVSPRLLRGEDRRLHVRQTLREDHQTRITDGEDDATAKFDELADDLYSFFRGTCLLFYRDMAGDDAWMPTVLCLGDVHPENFGVMPSRDDVPIFAVNDFDEASYAPFTWDVKRGAVGFVLAADTEGGHGRSRQRKIARQFVRAYADAMRDYADDETRADHQIRLDNAPPLIADLIEDALGRTRSEWLAEDYLDETRRRFRASERLVPVSSRRDEFQALVDDYVRDCGIEVPERAAAMRVKDVAERKGQGTASLGLDRYYLLIEGPDADGTDDLVLEMKQARRSALDGLTPPSDLRLDGEGERIAEAHHLQVVGGDVFYGSIHYDGVSYMIRERAPYRDDVDLDDLSKKEWKAYARICGQSLAQTHALTDDAEHIDVDIEPLIMEAIGRPELFVDDVVRWAVEAADRVRADHGAFRTDHALGAFEEVDRIYD
jgi:uncharacterized protein (DUF2252 family)